MAGTFDPAAYGSPAPYSPTPFPAAWLPSAISARRPSNAATISDGAKTPAASASTRDLVAHMVGYLTDDESAREKAVPVEDLALRRRRRRRLVAVALITIVVVAVGVGAGVGITASRKTSSSSAPSPIASPAFSSAPSPSGATASSVGSAPGPSSTARRMIIFGASYCDDGHPRASQYSGSLLPPPYYGGRHSNGLLWDEYLATLIAVGGRNNTDSRNYAYAGAMVDNSLVTANVPDTKSQMTTYLADVSSGAVPPLPAGGKTLVVLWEGLNPLLAIWATATYGLPSSSSISSTSVTNAQNSITQEAQALVSQVNNLRSRTAHATQTDYLILPLLPAELLPSAVAQCGGNANWLDLYASLTVTYNAVLLAGVAAMTSTPASTVLTYDIPALYREVMATPSIAGVTDVVRPCLSGSQVCSAPANHLWWDSVHQTTGVHHFLATKLAPAITALWKQ